MSADQQEVKKYGTLLGVFIPSILTILGAIMYLRFGWVVGNAGIWGTMAIVGLANAITLITALSVSSLATSQRVGVGGSCAVAALHDDVAAGGERRKRRPVRIGEGQGAHVGDGVVDVGDDQFEGARAGGHDALCSSASTM